MRTLLLLLVTIHVASFVPFVASAATLLVSGGRLMGATDVDVGGNLYDVAFVSEVGSPCVDLYTGCDSEADFDFQTEAEASLAANALLDQVFIDCPDGLFDSNPTLINGHNTQLLNSFIAMIPFGIASTGISIAGAYNFASGNNFVLVSHTQPRGFGHRDECSVCLLDPGSRAQHRSPYGPRSRWAGESAALVRSTDFTQRLGLRLGALSFRGE